MKTSLYKKHIFFYLVLVLTRHADSQDQWNPSLTETQKVAAMIELKHIREEAAKPSPIHAVISLFGQQCWIGVGGNTNLVVYRPLRSQAFDAHLSAASGKEISKAWFTHQFGRTLKPDKELLDGSFATNLEAQFGNSRMLFFPQNSSSHYWDFDILKSFRIKEPGEYRLQVQVRLFAKDTNGVFQPFILPPVETKVEISESDLGK
jgi:hypothetical protein